MISILICPIVIIKITDLTHRNFDTAKDLFEHAKENLYKKANLELIEALNEFYKEGYQDVELRRLLYILTGLFLLQPRFCFMSLCVNIVLLQIPISYPLKGFSALLVFPVEPVVPVPL